MLRASACTLGVLFLLGSGFLSTTMLSASPALAAEDDDDEPSFEQKILKNIMTGLGAVDPRDNNGIEYRERSPLVVPPKLDLPKPEVDRANAPNWPTDPEIVERKKRREAARKKKTYYGGIPADDVALPSELNAVGRAKVQASTQTESPGMGPYKDTMLPSELGSKGILSSVFSGMGSITGTKEETAPFKGEPPRQSLTQPPAGYQTPSSSYAYGITPEAKSTLPQEDRLMPSQLR